MLKVRDTSAWPAFNSHYLVEARGRGISLEGVCHQGLPCTHTGSPQHGVCVRKKDLCSPQILLSYHPGL